MWRLDYLKSSVFICPTNTQKPSVFHVDPPELNILPFTKATIEVTVRANDVDVEITDTLEIFVADSEATPRTIQLRAVGVGNTITIEPEIGQRLILGQQYESLSHARVFVVKNCGRRQQRLVWIIENTQCFRNEDFIRVQMIILMMGCLHEIWRFNFTDGCSTSQT